MEKALKKGFTFALLSAFSGAYLFIFSKYVLRFTNPETFCSVYYIFAAAYFLLWLALSGQIRQVRIPAGAVKIVLAIGVLESVSVIALYTAVRMMDPTLVSFFNNSQTIFIILLSAAFLRERFNRMEAVGTVVALAGIFLISYRSAHPVVTGMALTLASAVLFSCTVILVKKALPALPPLVLAFYRGMTIMLILNAYTLLTGRYEAIDRSLILPVAAGALFGPFLNILFYFYSLKHFDASKTSLVRASQPLFVLLNAALILQTVPSLKEIGGGLIIIAGLYVLVMGHERTMPAASPARPPAGPADSPPERSRTTFGS
jgi:drug/metabolite transporter (DMT)-like permease